MKGLRVGQKASASRVFTSADLSSYRELTGDEDLRFGMLDERMEQTTVPGPLLGGMVSYLLGTKLPGRGTIWLKQSYSFQAPAYVGDLITAKVEITRLRPEKDLVNIHVTCSDSTGEPVCTGEALVLVTDLEEI